jgi:hypothetical protein
LKRLTILAAAVMLTAGCAAPAAAPATTGTSSAPSEAAAEATPTPVVMGPGEYTFESLAGATGTMQIPGTPDPEIEKLRALVKGPAVTYLTVHVDNRQGTSNVNMYGVSIFTPDGQELKYTNADTYIDSIRPSDAPAAVYNQFIDASNKHGAMAKPKSVKDFVLTGPPVPKVITSVTVYPTGMSDPVDALPAS